jgi:type IV secretion system protein TrbI
MSEEQPAVHQRAQLPPGNIPQGRQTWIMLGVAVVIVLAVVFSGSTQPAQSTAQKAPALAVQTPSKVEIDRYTQALRAEEQRLRQAQAEASRSREAYEQQAGANRMQGGIPGQGVLAPNGQEYYPATNAAPPPPSAIEQDKEKREYASLFASNLALSFRKPAEEGPKPRTANAEPEQPPEEVARATEHNRKAPPIPRGGHTLFEGTILEAVLTNRLEGSFSGPVNCQVTTDVYSQDRQHLLIPKGSRVLGEARRVQEEDQQRLAIFFHRLIMPDGYSVSLDRMLGLDQAGATGLKDKVNRHILSTFGTSIALGLLAGFSLYRTGSVFTADGADMYRQGVASQLGRDSTRILDRQLNRLPTITIREGTRVRILLAQDLSLPAYDNHPPIPGV